MAKKNKSNKTIHFLVNILKIVLFVDAIIFLLLSIVSPWFLIFSIVFFTLFILCKNAKRTKRKTSNSNKVKKNMNIVNLEKQSTYNSANNTTNEQIIHTGIESSFPIVNNNTSNSELEITIPIEIENIKCTEKELEELSAFIDLYEGKKAR